MSETGARTAISARAAEIRRWGDALWRLLLAPPRVGFHAVAAALGLLTLWAVSLPGPPVLLLVGIAYLLITDAAVWAIKLVAHLVRHWRGTDPAPAGRWFALAPVGGLVVALLVGSGAAFELRWAASRPSLERVVAAQSDPAAPATTSGRIGLYRFLGQPDVIGDAVFFRHPLGGGLFDDAGFAYLPDGHTSVVDARFESLQVERIEGAWYRWQSSW